MSAPKTAADALREISGRRFFLLHVSDADAAMVQAALNAAPALAAGEKQAVFWITRGDLLRAEHEGDNVVACPAVGDELPDDAVLLYTRPQPAAPAPVAGDAVAVDAVPVTVLEKVLAEISRNAKRHGEDASNKRWADWFRSEQKSMSAAYHQAAHLLAVAIKTETVAALAQDRATQGAAAGVPEWFEDVRRCMDDVATQQRAHGYGDGRMVQLLARMAAWQGASQ